MTVDSVEVEEPRAMTESEVREEVELGAEEAAGSASETVVSIFALEEAFEAVDVVDALEAVEARVEAGLIAAEEEERAGRVPFWASTSTIEASLELIAF